MSQLKNYWSNLESRERRLLTFAGLFLLAILVYLLLWEPLHKKIDHYNSVVPQKRADLKWMVAHRDLAAELGSSTASAKGSNAGVLTVIEKTASKAGLRGAIKQMSPGDKPNEARLWFTEIEFNKWLSWTGSLNKEEAIQVKSANIQSVKSGIVDVRATFVRN